jgi:hypothetical protein
MWLYNNCAAITSIAILHYNKLKNIFFKLKKYIKILLSNALSNQLISHCDQCNVIGTMIKYIPSIIGTFVSNWKL